MPSNKANSAANPERVCIALAALAALLLGGLVALAQSDRGAVPNLRLSSASPGELTISLDAPDPAPSDYRVIWAKQDLDFLSYSAANEANRGNEYPGGAETTITLTGLTKGATFKVKARTRYTSGGDNNGPWSGPWTATATARVQEDPPPEPQPTPASTPQPPAAPTGLTTSGVAHDSVTISWTTPSQGSVTGYRILRGTDSNSLSAIVQNTDSTATEYTDSTVTAETTYYYAVLALSAEGDGAQSAAVSATTPAAPQQTTVSDLRLSSTAAGQLTISWDAPDPAPSDYRVIWAKQDLDFLSYSAANEANRGNEYPSGDETSITLTGLTKGATFKVKMRARYTSGGDNNGPRSGPWTDTVTARVKDDPPAAPTGLTASQVAHDSVTISWAAPSQGTVTSYRVMRGTETGNLSAIEEDTGNIDVEYTDSTVAAETTYYYAVLALSADGDGAQSATISATTPAEAQPVPSAPTGLTASRVAHDSVTLSWTAPTQGTVTGYRIFRGTDANSLAAIVDDTGSAGTEFTDSTVRAETTYYYAVRALSQDGDGAQSATVNATTPAKPRSKKDDPKGPPDTERLQRSAGDATGKPTITVPNVPRVPAILLARKGNIADTDGLPTGESKFSWQWVRVDGSTETDIPGATGTAYRLTAADVGKTIKVKVSFTDTATHAEGPLKSDATATITAAATDCNAPDPYPSGARRVWTGRVGVAQINASNHQREAISGFEYDAPRKFGESNPNYIDGRGGSKLDNPHFSGRHVATIDLLGVTTSPAGTLRLGTTGVIRDEERNQFTLYVCDTPFHFRDASVSGKLLSWSSSGLDWSVHAERTLYIHRDSTAPTVVSVEVTNDSFGSGNVLITFTEDLDELRETGGSAFTVKKTPAGGSEQTLTPDDSKVSGKTASLQIYDVPFLPTDTVTVSYAKPGVSFEIMADEFGNEVESFTDVLARKRHEPSGQDFSHYHDTLGFVGVGQDSSGRLPDRSDHRGDTFNLVGLEPSRTYRVEVVFNPTGSTQRVFNERYFSWDSYPTSPTVGGDIWLEQCCYLDRLYPVGEWDSNYDGIAIFDFKTGRRESGNTRWVTIIPDNYMKPNVRFYGEYTITLTDVTGLTRLVSNTSKRPRTVTYAKVGKNTDLHATDKTQLATSFVTGSNADGYTLDRITAYISLTDGTSTGTGVPKVAIYSNASENLPGTKLCDLQSLADYETGLSLSNGDWPDRLYAPDCADFTLAASTTYWVVFSEDSSEAQTYFVGDANSAAQDPRSASGWSIGDTYYRKTGTSAWVSASLFPLAIGVYGTPK